MFRGHVMKLSTFILDNIEQILQEWENFARTIFPASQQTSTKELRDHANQMLLVIVSDLEYLTPRKTEQFKQLGDNIHLKETAAQEHGAARLEQGFTINEIALEYQALRKSVMNLYGKKSAQIHPFVLNELVQFNESIDRSLSEAIRSYSFVQEQQTYLFNTMLSSSPDLSYVLDLNGSFLYVNKAMQDLYQQPSHQIIGKANYNFAMPSASDIREHIQYILETKKECHGEICVKKSPNEPDYFFEYVYAPVFDSNKKIVAIAGTSRDITKQKEAEAKVWHNANYDYLTGLANRRRFRDKLEEIIKHAHRTEASFALFFIDLDKFKEVNDQLGHEGGDHCLKKIADRISTCVRNTDVIARVGGDEFTIILTDNPNAEHVKIIAEKLLLEIKKPIRIKHTNVHLTASIGITLSLKDSNDPDVLLGYADQAMYAVKKLGGNRFSYHSP